MLSQTYKVAYYKDDTFEVLIDLEENGMEEEKINKDNWNDGEFHYLDETFEELFTNQSKNELEGFEVGYYEMEIIESKIGKYVLIYDEKEGSTSLIEEEDLETGIEFYFSGKELTYNINCKAMDFFNVCLVRTMARVDIRIKSL